DGVQKGFRMMIVQDAVADRWEESHKQSLFEMNAKYGDVIDSARAIEIMSQPGGQKKCLFID
ncbi:MAG: isochorismatase family protein, partial [Legionellaceae bacterium]|nr:isochorismatase family protein [Legionellaceae bacterium]